ncbi:MAG: phenol hydroxylase [Salinisphaeraceae bacterium]|jgi:phenol hydroxylase P0 protein|nr:phenol hydroxylase [Salinisphaeraceae bacterium]
MSNVIPLRKLESRRGHRCYVLVREERADGFVEFDFSIDDPDLAAELIMPRAAFDEFCQANDVIRCTPEQIEAIDHDKQKWRFGKPGVTE